MEDDLGAFTVAREDLSQPLNEPDQRCGEAHVGNNGKVALAPQGGLGFMKVPLTSGSVHARKVTKLKTTNQALFLSYYHVGLKLSEGRDSSFLGAL